MITIKEKSYSVEDIMRPAIFTSSTATLEETLQKMITERRNSLTVLAEDGTLAGMVNAIDIIKAVLPDYMEESNLAARFSNMELLKEDAERVKDTPVADFMETEVPTIKVDGNVIEAAAIAAHTGRGRIAVVNADNKPVGILTRTELKQVIGATLGMCGDCFADIDDK
ncbi:CBS domain-containing protein [Candidatus Kaiserbacteria bacterium]|nr:MAG: CBS domain-containing protein [Candidatus Kaiserbacteria bacterium]